MHTSHDNMDETIPIRSSLADLYPGSTIPVEEKRWAKLQKTFESNFGHKPAFVARSPGRVNIIGEHIDYSLYDCLPAGIAADVILAVYASPPTTDNIRIDLANVNPSKFSFQTFEVGSDRSVPIDASTHEWTNYFKAGLRGALALLSKTQPQVKAKNLSVLVDGTVPAGGGLSSSAAFVCASALAVLYTFESPAITKRSLVELAVVSERAVGVNSGGMDQAASVCSKIGHALHVSFFPSLATDAIPFPKTDPPVAFMIAQSFVESNKHVTGPIHYNLRVVEVTLAALYMAARLKLPLPKDTSSLGYSLRGFQTAYFESKHAPTGPLDEQERLQHILTLIDEHLTDAAGYDRQQIADILGISIPTLEERYMTRSPVRADRFLLRQRARYVFTEAIRVQKFITLLKTPSPLPGPESGKLLGEMGDLMNATQDSCREVYECSCAELDELCQIARRAGSYGSRLTGAGWGGCTVNLVPRDKVDAVRQAWRDEYYSAKFPDLSKEQLEEAVVVSEPGHGAMM